MEAGVHGRRVVPALGPVGQDQFPTAGAAPTRRLHMRETTAHQTSQPKLRHATQLHVQVKIFYAMGGLVHLSSLLIVNTLVSCMYAYM